MDDPKHDDARRRPSGGSAIGKESREAVEPHAALTHGDAVSEDIGELPDLLPAEIEHPPERIPPLPPDATPEQKDEHWYRYVYQGDNVRQLTWRAVLMGGVLGMFMSISNLYTTLKLGFYFGVAITACVLSFVIWNLFRILSGNRLTPMTILENNCMQSTASSAGCSTGHTVGLAFGALLLLNGTHTSAWYVVPFVLLTAALGVLVAVPMKKQMINIEQLPFPSGIAAAETLRSLHSHGREAVRKAVALTCALGAGTVIGFFKFERGVIRLLDRIYAASFHITDMIRFGGFLNPLASRGLSLRGLGFEPGTLMIAAGAFIGMRVSLSMLAGSLLLYYLVTPALLDGGALLYISGVDHAVTPAEIPAGAVLRPERWSLWGGTAVMLFSSLTAIAVQWRTIGRAFNVFKKHEAGSAQGAVAALEVPTSWVIWGLVPVAIGLVCICHRAFGMSWWLGLIAVGMSFVTALVASRSAGETDFTPTGAMGKITQLLYAVLAGGNQTVNLMSAGVTSAASAAAADLLTDLKSGHLLGAKPRQQFIAQAAGIFFGTLAVVPAWFLMVPDKAALEAFHPPSTEMWRAVAVALTEGLSTIPRSAQVAALAGSIIGVLIPVMGALLPKAAPYLPSGIGLGLSWVVTFQTSFSFAIGAILAYVWVKIHKVTAERYTFPIAAGLIAGESIVLALLAMTATGAKVIPTLLGGG